MVYKLAENLQTLDKELAERWAMPELGYSDLERALSLNYVFDFIVTQKRHSTKRTQYLIFKSKIKHIERWWNFKDNSEIEIIFINDEGFVESQFPWSWPSNKPSSNDIIQVAEKGTIFVQCSNLIGHSDYLDESFFSKEEVVEHLRREWNLEKSPRLTHDSRKLKRKLSERKYSLLMSNSVVNASYIAKKKKLKKKMTHRIKFPKYDDFMKKNIVV